VTTEQLQAIWAQPARRHRDRNTPRRPGHARRRIPADPILTPVTRVVWGIAAVCAPAMLVEGRYWHAALFTALGVFLVWERVDRRRRAARGGDRADG
jgi:hypothetical protein